MHRVSADGDVAVPSTAQGDTVRHHQHLSSWMWTPQPLYMIIKAHSESMMMKKTWWFFSVFNAWLTCVSFSLRCQFSSFLSKEDTLNHPLPRQIIWYTENFALSARHFTVHLLIPHLLKKILIMFTAFFYLCPNWNCQMLSPTFCCQTTVTWHFVETAGIDNSLSGY